jgi:hypothetical protein
VQRAEGQWTGLGEGRGRRLRQLHWWELIKEPAGHCSVGVRGKDEKDDQEGRKVSVREKTHTKEK